MDTYHFDRYHHGDCLDQGREMRRIIVANISDMHSGFSLGLMHPESVCKQAGKDGKLIPYTPSMTESQEYLWYDCYLNDLYRLKIAANGDPIIVILNGDLTHGDKHKSLLVSDRMSDQIAIGCKNLEPLFNIENVVMARFASSTGAHSFGEAASDILIAEQLKVMYPKTDISNTYHGLLDVDGFEIDYSHHGPYPGSREWLRGNVAGLYLRDIMIRSIERGEKPPDAVMRAHYHQWVVAPTWFGDYFSQLFVSPSYCMLGDYGHQVARSPDTIVNGMYALEIVDGKLREVHKFLHKLDVRTKESV